MVVHAYNPSCLGGIGRRTESKASVHKKYDTLSEEYLKQKGLELWLKQ
jgi:hypothetical protein